MVIAKAVVWGAWLHVYSPIEWMSRDVDGLGYAGNVPLTSHILLLAVFLLFFQSIVIH